MQNYQFKSFLLVFVVLGTSYLSAGFPPSSNGSINDCETRSVKQSGQYCNSMYADGFDGRQVISNAVIEQKKVNAEKKKEAFRQFWIKAVAAAKKGCVNAWKIFTKVCEKISENAKPLTSRFTPGH